MEGKEEAEEELVKSNMVEGIGENEMKMTVDEVVEGYVGSLGLSQLLHVFLVSMAWIFDCQNTLVTIFTDAQPSAWRRMGCVGGGGSTTIAEWSLICDRKFLAAVPASLFFLGSLLGSAVYGRLADSLWGRKKTLFISCLLTSITAFLTSFSPNLWIYTVLRFANGFSPSGIGICCLVLSTEVIGRNWRAQVGQYGFLFFTIGFLLLPLIAYRARTSWRNIYRIISLLLFLYSLFVLPFVTESPRWLLIKGRTKEAIHVLDRFTQMNGKKLPADLCLFEPSHFDAQLGTKMSLWTTKWAAKRIITVMVVGFGIGFVYYGVQLNVENLNFNLYFTVALNAAMEIPAVFIGSVLLSFTNRRLVFSQSACIAGVSCILCMIFTNGSWAQLGIEAIGFMASSTAFDVLYIYCVELFPTNVRNFAVSLLGQALMMGASMAPLLVVIGRLSPSLSFLVFGGFSIFSGILSMWLPETRNAPLYETLEQQEEEEEKLCRVSQELELGVVDQV